MLGRDQRNWLVSTIIALVLHVGILLGFITQMSAGISRKPDTEISIIDMPSLSDKSPKAVNLVPTIEPKTKPEALSQTEKKLERLSSNPFQAKSALAENDAQKPDNAAPTEVAALENDASKLEQAETATALSATDTSVAVPSSNSAQNVDTVAPESQTPVQDASTPLANADNQSAALSPSANVYAVDANTEPTINKAETARNFKRIEEAPANVDRAETGAKPVRIASAAAAVQKPAASKKATRLQQSSLPARPDQVSTATAPTKPSTAVVPENTLVAARPDSTVSAIRPDKTASAIRPDIAVSAIKPESAASSFIPENAASAVIPDKAVLAIKPKSVSSAIKAEKSDSAIKPDTAISAVKPDTAISAVKPESASSAIRPDTTVSAITPDRPTSAVRPESPSSAITPDKSASAIKPESASPVIRLAKNTQSAAAPEPTSVKRASTAAVSNKLATSANRARRPKKLRIQILSKAPASGAVQSVRRASPVANRAQTATRVSRLRPSAQPKTSKPTIAKAATPKRSIAEKVVRRRLALIIKPNQSLRDKKEAALRKGRLKFGRLNKFLEARESTTCLVALSTMTDQGEVRVSGIGRSKNPWARYLDDLSQATSLVVPASLARISDHQCQVASFIRRAKTYPVFKVRLDLEKSEITTGDFLKGTLHNIGDNALNLYLVDDEGTAQKLNSFLTSDENGSHFAIQLNIVGGATTTAQLLLAIVTDQPLESTKDNFPVVVTSLLEDVEQEIAVRNLTLDLAINAFVMK